MMRKKISGKSHLKPHTLPRQGLLELKNKYALGFVLINAMWVAGVYMLQVKLPKVLDVH